MATNSSANEELEKITAELRAHPNVLEVRWEIYRQAEKWEVCLDIGQALLKITPNRESGWVLAAQSFYYLKRYQQAFDTLAPALERFPKSALVNYDLACYHCLLGRVEDARSFVTKALELSEGMLKLRAFEDPDPKPLWTKIQSA